MNKFKFVPMETSVARYFQGGGLDAYGQAPERAVSDGDGNPCRHCLDNIPADEGMLILAYRPFPEEQPYAETGPIFLCEKDCNGFEGQGHPSVLKPEKSFLIRGYNDQDRIVYGAGKVSLPGELGIDLEMLFENKDVEYVHVRSSGYNCYQCRVEKLA